MKDDFIKFRCSTAFKEKVIKSANANNKTISDYLQHLIRKDIFDMVYVYLYETLEEQVGEEKAECVFDSIISTGLGVPLHENFNGVILSKEEKIEIDDVKIMPNYDLEEFIKRTSWGKEMLIIKSIFLDEDKAVEILSSIVYDKREYEQSYADIIYNSKEPYNKIKELTKKYATVELDRILINVQNLIASIKTEIEDGVFEWKNEY